MNILFINFKMEVNALFNFNSFLISFNSNSYDFENNQKLIEYTCFKWYKFKNVSLTFALWKDQLKYLSSMIIA